MIPHDGRPTAAGIVEPRSTLCVSSQVPRRAVGPARRTDAPRARTASDTFPPAPRVSPPFRADAARARARPPRPAPAPLWQVGCNRACSFCATGKMGFVRQLSTHEILSQVFLALRTVRERGLPPLHNVVFMGMGGPPPPPPPPPPQSHRAPPPQ